MGNLWTYLSYVADVLSVIGFAVSLYVAWEVRALKNSYIFRLRAPGFIKELGKIGSAYIALGNDFENSREQIGIELDRIDVKVRGMQKRLKGDAKRAAKQLRREIRDFEYASAEREGFYRVYRSLQRLTLEIGEQQTDLNLE